MIAKVAHSNSNNNNNKYVLMWSFPVVNGIVKSWGDVKNVSFITHCVRKMH